MEDYTGNSEQPPQEPQEPQENPQEQNAEFSGEPAAPPQQPEQPSASVVEPALEPDKNARLWATFCHLSALLGLTGFVFGFFLGPLIVWLIMKDEIPFLNANGKNALNFQISMLIYGLAALPLFCIPPLVFLIWGALIIIDVVFSVIATLKANNGQVATYPMSITFLK